MKVKSYLAFLALFEAVVTDVIDSFDINLVVFKEGKRRIGENASGVGEDGHFLLGRYSKTFSRFGKGRVIPRKSATRLKSFFP